MKYHFSDMIARRLKQNGWSHTRRVDPDPCVRAWIADGHETFKAGIDFASSFAGLKVSHPAYRGTGDDESDFDPISAVENFSAGWSKKVYRPLSGELLLPVGTGYSQHMVYLLGQSGALYGGYDNYFCLIGKTLEQAFENIFISREFVSLGVT